MSIPKKKYRDKVRARLALVCELFADREYTEELFRRILSKKPFGGKSDLHNKLEQFFTLLDKDLPALLDTLDEIGKNKSPQNQANGEEIPEE